MEMLVFKLLKEQVLLDMYRGIRHLRVLKNIVKYQIEFSNQKVIKIKSLNMLLNIK